MIAPPADVVLLVRPRERDALADRPLGGALHAHVDRQPDGRSGLGVPPDLERALGPAERVDADLGGARGAARYSSNVASTPDLPILSPPR